MKTWNSAFLPHARNEGIIVKPLGDDLLIYDLERHNAHSLNKTAALVWQHANGDTTVEQMRLLIENELGTPVDEKVIWLALEQLRKARLLKVTIPWAGADSLPSRRDAVRAFGVAAMLVPAIKTIVAPLAAAVISCRPNGFSCTKDSDCCSRNCNLGICKPSA